MAWVKTEQIGIGSFGSVYKAVHSKIPSLVVAIKSANPGSSLDKEINILRKLQGCNDHIIKLYQQIGTNDMVLEYASEGSLLEYVNKNYETGIPEPDARVYTRMILEGLCFMHKKNVVHCDLRLDNILVFPSINGGGGGGLRQLKLADFGLSKDLEDKSVENIERKFRGVCYYMSPESVTYERNGIMKKGIIGTALDIWSLGCVVIEMMSGSVAWGDYFEFEEFERYIIDEKRSPVIPSHFSQLAKDFISRCLERDHWKRWTAASLLRHPFITQS